MSKKKPTKGGGGGGGQQLQVSPEAGPELQEGLEACEVGLAVRARVGVAVRVALLQVWVQCKQLLQQPIPSKTLGQQLEVSDLLHMLSA